MNIFFGQFEQFLMESLFGLCVMAAVVLLNIFAFMRVTLAYRSSVNPESCKGIYFEMTKFISFVMLLAVTQLISLFVWVVALTGFGLVSGWLPALLFTASFFTSVGNFTEALPSGWTLIPSLVAFSGLFSFALATAATISMGRVLTEQLEKHK